MNELEDDIEYVGLDWATREPACTWLRVELLWSQKLKLDLVFERQPWGCSVDLGPIFVSFGHERAE